MDFFKFPDNVNFVKNRNVDYKICDPILEDVKSNYSLTSLSDIFRDIDAVLLVTEHDVFKKIDFSIIKNKMSTPVVIDGRNFFSEEQLVSLGFSYAAIGKPLD